MWQKCPICNGTGRVSDYVSSSTSTICRTCNGHKIISELTGLPPNTTTPLQSFNSGDFRDNCEQFENK